MPNTMQCCLSVKFTASVCDLTSSSQRLQLIDTVSSILNGTLNILDNIRINTVASWRVRTTISKPDAAVVEEYGRLIGWTPAGRIGEPEEILSMVAFLCLLTASYISEQIICVDGGFTADGWGTLEDSCAMLSAFSDALIRNNPEENDEGRWKAILKESVESNPKSYRNMRGQR
ncbi:tropinone reductase-like protein [Cucumis melo var. makuwa]|uniref:Tropinone reductase-like protein n=1 Tax=Cucumis melo var. makuwa TaxID=1194695 RepID=A0A5D3CKS5_CUCMM|nr:tropinone reductase-like protein [Cucumis melo var. makuwa]